MKHKIFIHLNPFSIGLQTKETIRRPFSWSLLFAACLLAFSSFSFTSCELLGLDLQEDYVFDANVPNPDLNMNAWEFILSQKNENLTLLHDAVTYVGIEEEYKKENRTYIMMSNLCFTRYLTDNKALSVMDLDKTWLKELLLGQIIEGEYSSYNLTTTPLQVETLNPGILLYLNLRAATISDTDKYQIRINDVPASSKRTSVDTSNLHATNGYIHIIDYTYAVINK